MRRLAWLLLLPLLVAWRWPGELNRLCRRAQEAAVAGDAGAAVTLYSEAIAAGGEGAELTYNLGTAQLAQRDYGGAVETLGRGLELARDAPMRNRLQYNRGNAYFRLDQIAEAARCYEQALLADPEDEDARYNLDLCRELLKQQQPPPPNGDQNQEQPPGGQGQQGGESEQNEDEQNPEGDDGEQNQPREQDGQGRSDSERQRDEAERQAAQNLLGMSEAELDRLLRELEKDEQQLRSYFRSRQDNAEDPFAEWDRRRRELAGGTPERDW